MVCGGIEREIKGAASGLVQTPQRMPSPSTALPGWTSNSIFPSSISQKIWG
jgi:hypothetical protein